MEASDEDSEQEESIQTIHQLGQRKRKEGAVGVQVTINKKPLVMEVDRSISISIERTDFPQTVEQTAGTRP